MHLEYQVPRLGIIRARLYPTAEMTYKILEKSGHIDRLRDNPQLGIIKGVSEGAHHTRWEYVMTQLFLVHKLNTDGPERSGLSRSKPKICGYEISGADIIQTWILLLNVGHLLGTFSNERALLNAFLNIPKLRAAFRSGLPDDAEIRSYFKKSLLDQNMYKVHELISYFFLCRLKRGYKDKIDLLIEVLKRYRFKAPSNESRYKNLKNHFQQIRQISYLFLDSNYSPVPFAFELSSILFNFQEHSTEIFSGDEGPLKRSLKSIEDLLNDTLYLAPKSMHALGQLRLPPILGPLA